ncbi:sulfurylase large subunit [Burkholderia sp. WAC0059]|uniref:XdhC family protein n=1 Tax=Burkholderia sp. WAC0059 TaxID=2066022 RepID=UPI000C7F6D99|nr:XdhC family protein [Burkholderia sp. WAC0059]PLZ04053.1 sulfurylase large subunit [Burkholderia sp. WAC0059]
MNTETDTDTLLQLEQRLIDAAEPFAVATVIRAAPPTSTWVGAQALVEADGTLHGWIGGGCSRAIVIEAARQAIRAGQPRRVRISNEPQAPDEGVESHAMPCASNGALELFIQPTVPAPLVLVLGATPAALEACMLAQRAGLRVGAAVGSALGVATQSFAAAGVSHVMPGFDAAAMTAMAPLLALVATQGDGDEDALEAALHSGAAAVLLIASRRKADRLRETMRLRGIDEARLAALHAPAGPPIHAQTPQEIALGAVAGLVAMRRELEQAEAGAAGQAAGPAASGGAARTHAALASERVPPLMPCGEVSEPGESGDEPAAKLGGVPQAAGGRYVNPVCGMSVEIASAKHVIEHGGQKVYFCCDCCKVEFEKTPERYMSIAATASMGAGR